MSTTSSATAALVYECSWANFQTGFLDWWAEWSTSSATSRKRTSPVWVVALATWGFLLGIAMAVSLLGPGIASGMSVIGTKAIASISLALAALSVIAVLVGLPVLAGVKAWRFSKSMCTRGWEIRTGQRKAWNSLRPA